MALYNLLTDVRLHIIYLTKFSFSIFDPITANAFALLFHHWPAHQRVRLISKPWKPHTKFLNQMNKNVNFVPLTFFFLAQAFVSLKIQNFHLRLGVFKKSFKSVKNKEIQADIELIISVCLPAIWSWVWTSWLTLLSLILPVSTISTHSWTAFLNLFYKGELIQTVLAASSAFWPTLIPS